MLITQERNTLWVSPRFLAGGPSALALSHTALDGYDFFASVGEQVQGGSQIQLVYWLQKDR